MTNTTNTVFVNILDKDYQVACSPDERSELIRSAQELDRRMRDIRSSGSVIGLERIAVMVALNLCHELLQKNQQKNAAEMDKNLLQQLTEKLDKAIDNLS